MEVVLATAVVNEILVVLFQNNSIKEALLQTGSSKGFIRKTVMYR
jgi:hypothetical protein